MATSSKYHAYNGTIRILKFLFEKNKPLTQKELIASIDLKSPYQLMAYLRKNEYVNLVETNGSVAISISEKGRRKVIEKNLDDLKIQKPKKWDKKWRLVFFDIPEKHKSARRALVFRLNELGFKTIQKSVYIHPYPCLEEIEALRTNYGIRKYVFFGVLGEIDGEKELKKIFKLPK